MNWLLVVLVALPLGAAALLLAWRRAGDATATGLGTVVAAVTLAVAVAASVAAAPYGRTGPGLEVDIAWVPALGLRMHLGLDGVSAPLVLLTALLTLLVCGHLTRVRPDPASSRGSIRGLVACVLAVEGGALGTFMALDLLLFFIAFEVVLVPMWFIVAFWGDSHQTARSLPPEAARPGGEAARRDAAMRFILYTGLGSAVMLLGLLLVALRTRTTDLVVLAHRAGEGIPGSVQTTAAALILLGLAVKAPMWPLHTWLPPAHTIAPTGGSVLLAGVLLKMGTYGMVRIVVPVLPAGMHVLAPWLAVFGVIGILWGGLVCLVERDLKRLIATSSVAHMGFVLLGIASMTPQGLQGALFANVAHGLITGLLFLVVGALKDRYHTADLAALGRDLRDRLPRLGWLLAFGAIAGLGLPGLAGFWGELLSITGAWQGEPPSAGCPGRWPCWPRSGPSWPPPTCCGCSACSGTGPRETRWAGMAIADVTGHELAVASPLVAATMAVGLLPWLLLDVTGPSVRALLAGRGGVP